MVKRMTIAATVVAATGAFLAGPGAGAAIADFVCPVLPGSEQRGQSEQFITLPNGDKSILPGHAGEEFDSPVDVGDHATNGDGAGSPGGSHSTPGDTDYTAIWSGN